MILTITFSDGSNPWVSLPTDRHTITKLWRRWMKYHPDTAQPVVIQHRRGWVQRCYTIPGQPGYYVRIPKDNGTFLGHYKTLGHALAALERLGGGDK